MQKTFELLPPIMPSHVTFRTPPAPRQQGFKPQEGFPVKNFTKEEAEEYAELMKQTFMQHWKDLQD